MMVVPAEIPAKTLGSFFVITSIKLLFLWDSKQFIYKVPIQKKSPESHKQKHNCMKSSLIQLEPPYNYWCTNFSFMVSQ